MKRRNFLTSVANIAGGIAGASLLPAIARAEDPIKAILKSRKRGSWNDQFDARKGDAELASTNIPILSPLTPTFIEKGIEEYRNISLSGGWSVVPANKKLRLGVEHKNVKMLRRRLIVSGDLAPKSGNSNVYDTWVDSAVKRFQARHGLPADGVMGRYTFAALNIPASVRLGQLETNLVRLRSMSGFLGNRYVMVNIPAAQIEAVDQGQVASRHTAIVGRITRQTPILNSKIYELNLNPYWTAPVSIVKKDLIPLMQKDSEYLTRNNIQMFAPDGTEIFPAAVDWNTEEAVNYRFRQKPGKINAMGSVKINFPNPHAVYMHDTPQQSLFSKLMRFESSGCVRVQNVRDLISWIAKDTEGWNRRAIEQVIETGERIDVKLVEPVPVYFTYITAWSTKDGVIQFRDDIYQRDGAEELSIQ
ncbi:MAG: L,D-transpeptidase family protein [Rhizobiaceae bacterium]